MTPPDIEQAVFDLEQVRIVIRAPASEPLGDYSYDRKAANNATISEWIDARLKPILNGHSVVVLNGSGELPHRATKMETLRQTYERA